MASWASVLGPDSLDNLVCILNQHQSVQLDNLSELETRDYLRFGDYVSPLVTWDLFC